MYNRIVPKVSKTMNLLELQNDIKKRHAAGETYQSIAKSIGINRALARHIGITPSYRPGKRIKKILNLDPSSDLLYTRFRRAILDGIAKKKGFASWCNYETSEIAKYHDEMARSMITEIGFYKGVRFISSKPTFKEE